MSRENACRKQRIQVRTRGRRKRALYGGQKCYPVDPNYLGKRRFLTLQQADQDPRTSVKRVRLNGKSAGSDRIQVTVYGVAPTVASAIRLIAGNLPL